MTFIAWAFLHGVSDKKTTNMAFMLFLMFWAIAFDILFLYGWIK